MNHSDDIPHYGPWAIERTNPLIDEKTVYAVVRGNSREDAESEAKELNESFPRFSYRVVEG